MLFLNRWLCRAGRSGLIVVLLMSGRALLAASDKLPDYKIIHRVFEQPLDHFHPGPGTVFQQVDILVPSDAPVDAPVFFRMGAEDNLSAASIAALYHIYGRSAPVIFVEAEHRGYGQSLSDNPDQTTPSYARIDQALADAHAVIQLLRREYPGPWMAAGYSQGGGLVIDFAASYPNDVEVILVSSGPLDAPLRNNHYDECVKRTFGAGTYRRLSEHAHALSPSAPFDEAWREREFLWGVVKGLMQDPQFRQYRVVLKLSSYLETDALLGLWHWLDDRLSGGSGRVYAESVAEAQLSHRQAATGGYTYRVWRYQQCTEVGTFDSAADPDGLMYRTREELCAECRLLFGEAPFCEGEPTWSPRERLQSLTVPVVFVSGGEDPWMPLCFDAAGRPRTGRNIYIPSGGHCPDLHDPDLAEEVIREMLKWAARETSHPLPVGTNP